MKSLFELYLITTFLLVVFCGLVRGGNLAPNGEVQVRMQSLAAQIPNGKITIRCADDGGLLELTISWNGKSTSVPRSELKDIALADLQSLQVTTPSPDPPGSNSESLDEGEEYCFVTMAFGSPIVTDDLRNIRQHVRFEFFKGGYVDRMTAIPDTSGKHWKIHRKAPGKDQEEFDEHVGTLQPWSLVRE